MLSPEQLDEYRQMTAGQRLALSFRMLDECWPHLMRGSKEAVDRKFAAIERENDLRNANLLAALARAHADHDAR